jgi:hypothetical protein
MKHLQTYEGFKYWFKKKEPIVDLPGIKPNDYSNLTHVNFLKKVYEFLKTINNSLKFDVITKVEPAYGECIEANISINDQKIIKCWGGQGRMKKIFFTINKKTPNEFVIFFDSIFSNKSKPWRDGRQSYYFDEKDIDKILSKMNLEDYELILSANKYNL